MLHSSNTLMLEQGLIRDIQINMDDKLALVLTGPDGEAINPDRLNAGERQLLAVSPLWSPTKADVNRRPNVIDTPLGRLDSEHRELILDRYFPDADRRVLLLSTDEGTARSFSVASIPISPTRTPSSTTTRPSPPPSKPGY